MNDDTRTVTVLLKAIEGGDAGARGQLFDLLYSEMHARAAKMARERPKLARLQATALVHEAYLRLVGGGDEESSDRDPLLGCAAKAVREVLTERARRRHRGFGEELLLDAVVDAFDEQGVDIAELDVALDELEDFDPEMARAVEMRFFGGASETQVAHALRIPSPALQRRWGVAKAWLRRRIDAS